MPRTTSSRKHRQGKSPYARPTSRTRKTAQSPLRTPNNGKSNTSLRAVDENQMWHRMNEAKLQTSWLGSATKFVKGLVNQTGLFSGTAGGDDDDNARASSVGIRGRNLSTEISFSPKQATTSPMKNKESVVEREEVAGEESIKDIATATATEHTANDDKKKGNLFHDVNDHCAKLTCKL